jgi:hypothetical protein
MRYLSTSLAIVLIFAISTVCLRAADAPPAAAPTSAPAPPRKVILPKGFKVVTVNARTVICEPADEAWVGTALNKVQATTKPATLPAQLLARLMEQRSALLTQLAKDLALSDLTAAAATFDKDLVGAVRVLDEYKPDIYYLACTPDRLAEVMRGGWTDPHFYYNRAADAVTFNPVGVLATDRPQDDVLFPAAYNKADPPEKRGENLSIVVSNMEGSIQDAIERLGRQTVGSMFAQLVSDNGIKPLNLKDDQQWFALGVAAVLSAKYTAVVTREPAAGMTDALATELPGNPLKGTAIDLIHPQDPKMMRDEALPAYFDTFRRKSARAARVLMEKGGEQAIPKAVMAIREKKPADGTALVAVIKDASGIDLTPQLSKGM